MQDELGMKDFLASKADAAHAARILKKAWGEKNPGYAHAIYFQALAEYGLQEWEPAERHFRQAIEILQLVAAEGHSDFYVGMYGAAQVHLARLLNDQGRYDDAEPFARSGSEVSVWGALAHFAEGQLEVARSVSGQGKNAEAEVVFACLIKTLDAKAPQALSNNVLGAYAEHLRRTDRDAEADRLAARLRLRSAQSSRPIRR